jgi:uncharacterized Zn finger protein
MQLGLERFFDAGSLAKGIAYAREGRVITLSHLAPDGQLTAKVSGSGRQIYAVQLRLTFGNDLRVNGRVKVSQRAAQNVATLGLARLPRERAPASGRPRFS